MEALERILLEDLVPFTDSGSFHVSLRESVGHVLKPFAAGSRAGRVAFCRWTSEYTKEKGDQ